MGKVGLVRGGCGGEAEDFFAGVVGDVAEAAGFGWTADVGVSGDDGVGMGRVGVGEIVFLGAVLGAKLIEITGGEDSGVALLPGADVDARDGECVGGLSGAEEHAVSIAEKQGTREQGTKGTRKTRNRE
jgi:hypothetical protein